jgi:hypothetical protein
MKRLSDVAGVLISALSLIFVVSGWVYVAGQTSQANAETAARVKALEITQTTQDAYINAVDKKLDVLCNDVSWVRRELEKGRP